MTKIIRQGNDHEFAKSLDEGIEDFTLLLRRDLTNGVEHLEEVGGAEKYNIFNICFS